MPTAGVPHRFPVAVNGRPYMVDTREGGYQQQSIPLQRAQTDVATDVGEHSLSSEDLWRRSMVSWHRGAGQTFFDQADSDPSRFRSSLGIDPWTKGEMSLLLATESKRTNTTDLNLRLCVAGDRLYLIDGQQVLYTTDVLNSGAATWIAVTGTPAASATWITSDGFNVYVSYGASGIYTTTRTSGSASSYATGTVDVVEYVKGRLMAANDNAIYNVTAAGALPAALYTQANTDFVWVGFAEGLGDIYAAGYSGDKSLIYKTQIQADGTALDTPVVAGRLPDGEIVRAIYGYLGFIFVGTDGGVRMAQSDADGNLIFGALIRTPGGVRCFEGQGQYVWFGYENIDADDFSDATGVDEGSTYDGLGRLDLTQLILPLTPAHATDIYYDSLSGSGERVTSVVTFQQRRVFTIVDFGGYEDISVTDLAAVAMWRLGESAGTTAEEVVANRDGTYTNSPTLGAAGILDDDTAVTFNGTDEYVTVPDAAALSPQGGGGDMSISAWIKPTSVTGERAIVSKNGGSGWEYELRTSGTNAEFQLWQGGGASHALATSSGVTLAVGTWYHIVGVVDGGNSIRIFVNGVERGVSTSFTGSVGDGTEPLNIGRRPASADTYFAGTIDEVALYSVALTAVQVGQLYQAGLDGVSQRVERGVIAETAQRVASGFLRSGLISYGIGDTKVATYIDMLCAAKDGEVAIWLNANEGAFALIDSTITDATTLDTYTVGSVRGDRHEVMFRLNRDANAPTVFQEGRPGEPAAQETPTLVRLTLRSEPAPKRGRIFTVPLRLYTYQDDLSGAEFHTEVDSELTTLYALFNTQTLVAYEDRSTSTNVFVRDIRFEAEVQTKKGDFWQGVCTVVLKEPAA